MNLESLSIIAKTHTTDQLMQILECLLIDAGDVAQAEGLQQIANMASHHCFRDLGLRDAH